MNSLKPLIMVLVCVALLRTLSTGYAAVSSPLLIDSDSDFVTNGYPGSGTADDPYLIESLQIDSKGSRSNGIEVTNTHAYFVVARCEIKADYIGILVQDVAPGTASLEDNIITGNTGDGGGIVLGADGVRVVGNTCKGFSEGIHTNYSDECVIVGNDLINNNYHGLSLRYSNQNIVANNTIIGNKAHGIFIIRDSKGNTIYNNTLTENASIKSYEWDEIYHFEVKSQALDVGMGNVWSSEELKLGNRWSDYTGSGTYRIDGSANAVDAYPISTGESAEEESKPSEKPGQWAVPGYPVGALAFGLLLVILLVARHRAKFRGY